MLVLLPILHDYFNDCARARSLGIVAQIKKNGRTTIGISGLWFDIYAIIFCPSEKYKIVSW
jgi:hypothetical protein